MRFAVVIVSIALLSGRACYRRGAAA